MIFITEKQCNGANVTDCIYSLIRGVQWVKIEKDWKQAPCVLTYWAFCGHIFCIFWVWRTCFLKKWFLQPFTNHIYIYKFSNPSNNSTNFLHPVRETGFTVLHQKFCNFDTVPLRRREKQTNPV